MKATAKILVLAILGSSLAIFLSSCSSGSSSSVNPYEGSGGTMTSSLIGRQRGGVY